MTKYLVTGGAGFIGSNIVERLVQTGDSVRVVDNLSTGKMENIEAFIQEIEFIHGDLSDRGVAQRAVEGVDYVLHQAAIPSVPRSIADPVATNQSIVTSTVNLFRAAVDAGRIRRIVQATSSSAYGDTPTLPKVESMAPNPRSPYAVAKLTQEYYGKAFHTVYGLEITSLRYFNIFGPRQDPHSPYSAVIPKFIETMKQGRRPTIYGDGLTSRDFTYVDNAVEANILACHAAWTGASEVINIGCGAALSLNALVETINKILGTDIQPNYEAGRVGDVKHSLAGIAKAREILGYEVRVGVEEGLRRLTGN